MNNIEEINKRYVYFYSGYLLLGFLLRGYITFQYGIIKGFVDKEVANWFLGSKYISIILGSLLGSIFVRISKRKRLIFANTLILISSVPIYWADTELFISVCGALLGIGIGLSTSIIPFYLNEILPAELSLKILTGLGISLVSGNWLRSTIEWAIKSNDFRKDSFVAVVAYFFPPLIASVNLLLGLFVFTANTPKELCEETNVEICLLEINKMYDTTDRRVKEYMRVQEAHEETMYRYPSYSEIFSKRHIKTTLKGIAMITLHNFSGSLFLRLLSSMGTGYDNTSDFEITTAVLDILKLGATFIPFFLITRFGLKKLMLVGFIGIATLPIISFIIRFVGKIKAGDEYFIVIELITGLEFICDGASSCCLPYIYSCKVLPERGFGLGMGSHWITFSLIMMTFLIFTTGNFGKDTVYYSYMGLFTGFSMLTVVFIAVCVSDDDEKRESAIGS